MGYKENLFSLRQKKTKTVSVEGQEFVIRMMSGTDAISYSDFIASNPPPLTAMTKLVSLGLSDESGNRILADSDLEQLAELPISIIRSLFEAIADYNALKDDGQKAIEKN